MIDKQAILITIFAATLLIFAVSLVINPDRPKSSRKLCEEKGGQWFHPRDERGICLDKKFIIQ